jgi:hypothetical protein
MKCIPCFSIPFIIISLCFVGFYSGVGSVWNRETSCECSWQPLIAHITLPTHEFNICFVSDNLAKFDPRLWCPWDQFRTVLTVYGHLKLCLLSHELKLVPPVTSTLFLTVEVPFMLLHNFAIFLKIESKLWKYSTLCVGQSNESL